MRNHVSPPIRRIVPAVILAFTGSRFFKKHRILSNFNTAAHFYQYLFLQIRAMQQQKQARFPKASFSSTRFESRTCSKCPAA
jgi:hypothetical protein